MGNGNKGLFMTLALSRAEAASLCKDLPQLRLHIYRSDFHDFVASTTMANDEFIKLMLRQMLILSFSVGMTRFQSARMLRWHMMLRSPVTEDDDVRFHSEGISCCVRRPSGESVRTDSLSAESP